MEKSLKKTPLYSVHKELGAKFVPFAGYEMPVQYTGVIEEHQTVRQRVGLFDVSHMGEIFFLGPQAEQTLNYLTCNDVAKLRDGMAQYSAFTTPGGGIVDDIIIYRISSENFLVCVNAANRARDLGWVTENNRFDAEIVDRSEEYAQIAIQGPRAREVFFRLVDDPELRELKPFHFLKRELFGTSVIIARTGYTGEDGFELFLVPHIAPELWKSLLTLGSQTEILSCGLGARDSLRLEACYPLHGHELSEEITAIESGLGWIVKPGSGEFIGREVLEIQKQEGAPRSLIGFFINDAGIARHGDLILTEDGEEIGFVTSGTKTPTLQRSLGLGLVKSEFSKLGTGLVCKVRSRELSCEVVKRPFYKIEK